MAPKNTFISGRTGRGAAYVSDASGASHDRFMRLTARALLPLGLATAWLLARLTGDSFEEARAELERPFPAVVLIAFIAIGAAHARLGAESIILDYVHDEALKQKALVVNTWVTRAIALAWAFAILLIAAPR
ncbi:MAG TPA: succinate dehydrogenase, hydrophobic membrane anchor protein [Methylocystis sp.]|nr:succinate dehydrogenase, hydrophobic membrane anchor protein [Methylocystis sp.]